ncbi:hypothetical protein [Myroides odoratimimus]|uniref:hypothetical protein n=1 Tax=Myroides odoratimimus TaxID=76832 RepID=UPI003101191C
MKNIGLVIMMLVMVFVAGCSKEDLEVNNKGVSIQYNGTSVETRKAKEYTNFYFTIRSKVRTPMQGYVEVVTINNEKIKSDRFSLDMGEHREVLVKKEGVVVDRDYVKSYKVYATPINFDAFPNKGMPSRDFFNPPMYKFPKAG